MFPRELHSVFHFSKKQEGLLLTEPEIAFLYFSDKKINLLTGEVVSIKIIDELKKLENYKVANKVDIPEVFHFCYELGHCFASDVKVSSNIPLFIRIRYKRSKWISYPGVLSSKISLLKGDSLTFKDYQKNFNQIMKHLLDGDCYQVNYTHVHQWSSVQLDRERILKCFYSSGNLSEYAHHTYIPYLEKLILSNSPECLFQVYRHEGHLEIHSTPIKGTLKGEDQEKAKELFHSEKNIAELNMITDLVRNDLAKIEQPRVRVLHRRLLLKVPGLWHLYSRIAVKTSKKVNLYQVLSALFPGGSVTGAPKRRVMKIIDNSESSPRGHYCGSTFLNFGELSSASINIRTFEIDLKNQLVSIGAGGGITLQSGPEDEYQEMLLKQESLLKVLHLISCQ